MIATSDRPSHFHSDEDDVKFDRKRIESIEMKFDHINSQKNIHLKFLSVLLTVSSFSLALLLAHSLSTIRESSRQKKSLQKIQQTLHVLRIKSKVKGKGSQSVFLSSFFRLSNRQVELWVVEARDLQIVSHSYESAHVSRPLVLFLKFSVLCPCWDWFCWFLQFLQRFLP